MENDHFIVSALFSTIIRQYRHEFQEFAEQNQTNKSQQAQIMRSGESISANVPA
jgi:hypothetical protein